MKEIDCRACRTSLPLSITNGLVALLSAEESLWVKTDLLCPIYCQNAQHALPLGQSENVKYDVTDVVSLTG